jgi:hypothetical protein
MTGNGLNGWDSIPFATTSRFGLTKTPYWVQEFFSGVTRPQREANHSPPSTAEIKNVWSLTFTSFVLPNGMVLMNGFGSALILFMTITLNLFYS